MTAGHAVSQAVKGLQGVIALNEDIGSLERKYKDMESSVEGLKKEVASLAESEKRATNRLKEVQDLLMKEKDISKGLHDGISLKLKEVVFTTRHELMVEFSTSGHLT